MTIQELKKEKGYSFECNISESLRNEISWDEWGAYYVWLGENIGAEYNFCIDNGNNCSAIYKMEFNHKTGYMETDYDAFMHYEIDFNSRNWKEKLENAMCKALIKFFGL